MRPWRRCPGPGSSLAAATSPSAGRELVADVAAKAAFVLGDDGPGWLAERSLPGRFVAAGGVVVNEAWQNGLGREPACT